MARRGGAGLQRVDAFVVRLNSDIVLYDEQARRELLSGTVFWGVLLSFVSFWLFASLAFIVPLFLWRWWVRRDVMVRFDQQFQALARKDGLHRAIYEGHGFCPTLGSASTVFGSADSAALPIFFVASAMAHPIAAGRTRCRARRDEIAPTDYSAAAAANGGLKGEHQIKAITPIHHATSAPSR